MKLLYEVIREPLVHFCIGGCILFAVYWGLDEGRDTPHEIVVTAELRAGLRSDHLRRHKVEPTQEQLEGLLAQWVEQEVLLREAYELGLDRGDPVVRRRLVQAMRFFVEDYAPIPEPTEAQLEDWLRQNQKSYTVPSSIELEHRYFSERLYGEGAEREATEALPRIEREPELAIGDAFIHGSHLGPASRQKLGRMVGSALANQAFELPVGQWVGPIASVYGFHLVRVTARLPSHTPPLPTVRARLRADWISAQRARARDAALAKMKERYAVHMVDEEARP